MKLHAIKHEKGYFGCWTTDGRPVWVETLKEACKGYGDQMLMTSAKLIRQGYYPLLCASLDTISTTGSHKDQQV